MEIIYFVCKDIDEANKISKKLLEKHLVGCVNIFPIFSMYWWEGKICNDNEVVVIAKTLKGNFSKVKEEIEKSHSYQVPCIICWDIKDVNEKYFEWLKENVF